MQRGTNAIDLAPWLTTQLENHLEFRHLNSVQWGAKAIGLVPGLTTQLQNHLGFRHLNSVQRGAETIDLAPWLMARVEKAILNSAIWIRCSGTPTLSILRSSLLRLLRAFVVGSYV